MLDNECHLCVCDMVCDRVGKHFCVLCNTRLYVCVPRWAVCLCVSLWPVCAALWETGASYDCGGPLHLQEIVGKSVEGVCGRLIGSGEALLIGELGGGRSPS